MPALKLGAARNFTVIEHRGKRLARVLDDANPRTVAVDRSAPADFGEINREQVLQRFKASAFNRLQPPDSAWDLRHPLEIVMGKYLIGWVLGIPAIVLVIAYFFFH